MRKNKRTVLIAANVFGLGKVCEALACAVGQIAPNPCYKLAAFIGFQFVAKVFRQLAYNEKCC